MNTPRNIPGITYKRDPDYSELESPAYRVLYNGIDIGGVKREHRVSAGYWGSWITTGAGWGEVGDSRTDITRSLIRRHGAATRFASVQEAANFASTDAIGAAARFRKR